MHFFKKEVFGDYEVVTRNGKELLMQNYGNCKEGYRSAKCFELPVSRLTPEQKQAWETSVKANKPINPFTNRAIQVDGPTGAMLMILSKRR